MPINSIISLGSSSIKSITDEAAQLISSFQSKISVTEPRVERRNAVRYKITNIKGHKLIHIILKEPTCCSQCTNLIWGIMGQSCKLCKLVSHNKCINSIASECVCSESELLNKTNYEDSHQFKENYFLTPTFCNHCGILLKGVTRSQGLECDPKTGGCGISIHRECKRFIGVSCNLRIVTGTPKDDKDSIHSNDTKFKDQDLAIIKSFELLRLIGRGGFSKVYLARLKTNRQEFAIKVMKKTNLGVSSDPEMAITEKKVLNLGRQYPFLTVAHCCFQSRERLYFVMEHVKGRDLLFHLGRDKKFTEDRARFYAAEIVLALRFLHKKAIVYRDLKLDNIILDEQGHCKLLDFGMSKELTQSIDMKTRTFCGTSEYISPEIIREQDYGFSVDWWTLGVLTYEMLIGYSPFHADCEEEIYKMILNEEVRIPKFVSLEARNLIEGFLTKDPNNRLGCLMLEGCEQAILEHPFFSFKSQSGARLHQWEAIEAKRLKPPHWNKPNPSEEYDDSYTDYSLSLSPVSSDQLDQISQSGFKGFSFYSDSFKSTSKLNI